MSPQNVINLRCSLLRFESHIVDQNVGAVKIVGDGVGNQSLADVGPEAKEAAREHAKRQTTSERKDCQESGSENRNHDIAVSR